MAKSVSYINSAGKKKSSDNERDLEREVRELRREIDSMRKSGISTAKRLRELDETVEWPNVVVI